MSKIDDLRKAYEQFVGLPWLPSPPVSQKVWFAVYDPVDERRLRQHIGEFANATRRAGHAWRSLDLTGIFAEWMGQHDYQDAYFESPDDLDMSLAEFEHYVVDRVASLMRSSEATPEAVVALYGVASLFGFMSLSKLMDAVTPFVRGRLLVFFPGQHDGTRYRFLDAHANWNYHAVPIKPSAD